MSDTLASNVWVIALTIVSMLATAAVLREVVNRWAEATGHLSAVGDVRGTTLPDTAQSTTRPRPEPPTERAVLLMIILMGALGGLVHLTSSLAKYVGNRQLKRSWIVYYILMPVEGAALAPMIYLLMRAGVLSTPADGATSAANLNVVVLYGFAGLTGLFAKQAIEMLADVFATIFKRVKAKDSIDGGEKAGGGA